MSTRKNWAVGLLFGGVVGWLLYKLIGSREDDRPPIRVRGGSIRFHNDYGWLDASGEWKTGQTRAKRVKYFTVTVDGRDCGLQKGPELHITYETITGKQEVFKVIHRGGEPRIVPGGLLKEDDDHVNTIVHDADGRGRLARISAPPHPHNVCVLTGDPEIKIEYEYQ